MQGSNTGSRNVTIWCVTTVSYLFVYVSMKMHLLRKHKTPHHNFLDYLFIPKKRNILCQHWVLDTSTDQGM